MRTPLAFTTSWLCRVANLTSEPATVTGSTCAYGVTRPVRPTPTRMSTSCVHPFLGAYFQAMAQRGAREVEPRRPCSGISSSLTDDPVDLVLHGVPVLAVVRVYLLTPSRSSTTFAYRVVGRPQECSSAYASERRERPSKPSRAPIPWTTMCSGRLAVTRGSF